MHAYSGIRCPVSGLEIDFEDEGIAEYIAETFVLGVFASVCPEHCAIGGELNQEWTHFYDQNGNEMGLKELVAAFPVPYKAIEVSRSGMACGPVGETVFYVVPKNSLIEPLPRGADDFKS